MPPMPKDSRHGPAHRHKFARMVGKGSGARGSPVERGKAGKAGKAAKAAKAADRGEEAPRRPRRQAATKAQAACAAARKDAAAPAKKGKDTGVYMEADDAAAQYLKQQHQGAKGIRKAITEVGSEAEHMVLREDIYQKFADAESMRDPRWSMYPRTLPDDVANEWLWLSTTNSNVLAFGVGDKAPLLDAFEALVRGEDVLALDGNPNPHQHPQEYHTNSHTTWPKHIMAALDVIAADVLRWRDREKGRDIVGYAREIARRLDIHYGRVVDFSPRLVEAELPASPILSKGSSSTSAPTVIAAAAISSGLVTHATTSHTTMTAAATAGAVAPAVTVPEKRTRTLQMNRAVPKYTKGRYAHSQPRLYVLIHELCGPAFAHRDAQACLSILAACRSVSVVATVDFLNIAQLWDAATVARFAWSFYHLPTYLHHALPADHCVLINKESQGKLSRGKQDEEPRMNTILQSLPDSHKELLQIVCRCAQLRRRQLRAVRKGEKLEDRPPHENPYVVPNDDVLKDAVLAMLVKTKADLYDICKNFFDHKILEDVRTHRGDFLKVMLADEYIDDIVSGRR